MTRTLTQAETLQNADGDSNVVDQAKAVAFVCIGMMVASAKIGRKTFTEGNASRQECASSLYSIVLFEQCLGLGGVGQSGRRCQKFGSR